MNIVLIAMIVALLIPLYEVAKNDDIDYYSSSFSSAG
jgi:multicomponent Na+:H+ antiporter subunit F